MDPIQAIIVDKIRQNKECLDNRDRLKGFLLDILSEEKLKRNMILWAYDEDIVDRLIAGDVYAARGMACKLQKDYGLSADNAQWCVETWGHILSVDVSMADDEKNIQEDSEAQHQQAVNSNGGDTKETAGFIREEYRPTCGSDGTGAFNIFGNYYKYVLDELTESEQKIFRQMHEPGNEHTIEEVCNLCGVSKQQVLQVEKKALRKLSLFRNQDKWSRMKRKNL